MRTYIIIDENNKVILKDTNISRIRDVVNFRRERGKFYIVLCELSLSDGYSYTEKVSEEMLNLWND